METKSLHSYKYILPVWYNQKVWQQKLITGFMLAVLFLIAGEVSSFIWNTVLPVQYNASTTIQQSTNQKHILSVKHPKNHVSMLSENTWFGISPDLAINSMDSESVANETALNLSLKGTIMGSKPQAFIVDNETGKTHLVKLNGTVIGGVTLSDINRRQVVITNNGKKETLSLPSAMLGGVFKKKVQPTYTVLFDRKADKRQTVNIASADVAYALGNLGALATEAKFIPRVAGGTTEGYKIMKMKNNSFLRKLSLQERDILLKLDNVLISDKSKIFPMLMDLKTASKARLLIHRQGKNIALDINVVN
jgi:type II secretion system protein C